MADIPRSRSKVRQRIRELDAEKVELVNRMEVLAREFQQAFRRPWPAHPVVQRVAGGHVYVRWRLQGRNGKQNYVDLACGAGQTLLSTLDLPTRSIYVRYGQEMLNLNLAHALRQSEWVRLRQYLADCVVLEEYINDKS
ncbi:MAG: hypothetical protein IDH49_08045 [Gammaproteobacteria bacterium]|nr:hypothetical protein [Gammaproteobacteria bacterium]